MSKISPEIEKEFKKDLITLKISLEGIKQASEEYSLRHKEYSEVIKRIIDTILNETDVNVILDLTKQLSEASKTSLDYMIEQLTDIRVSK